MTEICKYCKKEMKFTGEDEDFHDRTLYYECQNEDCEYGPELQIHICENCERYSEWWDPDIDIKDDEIPEIENESKIDIFLKWLDEKNYRLCPFMDMESKYCQNHYQQNICKCQNNCDSCDKKVWNNELGIPINKDYKIQERIEEKKKKLLYFEKNYYKITKWMVEINGK